MPFCSINIQKKKKNVFLPLVDTRVCYSSLSFYVFLLLLLKSPTNIGVLVLRRAVASLLEACGS